MTENILKNQAFEYQAKIEPEQLGMVNQSFYISNGHHRVYKIITVEAGLQWTIERGTLRRELDEEAFLYSRLMVIKA